MNPLARVGNSQILRPLRNRDFRLLWAGMTVSLLGDGIYIVAIAWQVYELSNAPTALAVVGVAWTLPMLLFVLVGGVLSDRFDRRTLMLVSDVVRALAIGAIGVLSVTGALELWQVLVLVAFYGAGDALFVPAFQAIVPDLVPTEHLLQANSLDMLMRPLALQLIGPALGGVAIAVAGTGAAFLLDAGTFVVSACLLLAIPRRPLPQRGATSVRSVFHDMREGYRFVRSITWLWGSLVAASFSLLFSFGPAQVLLPYVVKNELGGSAGDFGLALAAAGLGSIGAALVLGGRSLPRRHITVMYTFWGLTGFGVALWGLATGLWQIVLISILRGAGVTVGTVIWMTMVHTRVPRELLGRVASFDWMLSLSLIPVSFALTGPIAEALGPRETLVAAGVLGGTVIFGFLFLPGMRATEREKAAYDRPEREVHDGG
jgi:MFS family permease